MILRNSRKKGRMGFIGILLTLLAGVVAIGTVATLFTGHYSAQHWAYSLSSVCFVFLAWLIWFAFYAASQIPSGIASQPTQNPGSTTQQQDSNENLRSAAQGTSTAAVQAGEKGNDANAGANGGESSPDGTDQQESSKFWSLILWLWGLRWLRLLEVFGTLALTGVIAWFAFIQSDVAGSQRDVANKQWDSMQAQNEIMKGQMAQTEQMIEQMRLDQRAWLCPRDTPVGKPEATPFTIVVPFVNSGSVPARMTISASLGFTKAPGESIDQEVAQLHTLKTRVTRDSSFAPGAEHGFRAAHPSGIKQSLIDDVIAGRRIFYLLTIIEYSDPVGGGYATQSCFYYDGKDWSFAGDHNYMK